VLTLVPDEQDARVAIGSLLGAGLALGWSELDGLRWPTIDTHGSRWHRISFATFDQRLA
jgi:hypothetical protein